LPKLDASSEELSLLYAAIKGKRGFGPAFSSLSGLQQKLVQLVYVDDVPMSIARAALELPISYLRAVRQLNKALKTMRKAISSVEGKKRASSYSEVSPLFVVEASP
jgi:hypothetical protein